jgi:predicted Zn finger-like uncharacterized protein
MIAACPECPARYRVEDAKVGPRGARIRCVKCSTIFRVAAPESSAALDRSGVDPTFSEFDAPGLSGRSDSPGDCQVVLATGDDESVAGALQSWGLGISIASDGAEAMLAIQRSLPQVAILGVDLAGINGEQICEVIKRNESLREIKVILVAGDARALASLAGTERFGADACLARPELLDNLNEIMREFGLSLDAGGPTPPPESGLAPPPPPASRDGLDEERAKAERLARIVVSDIALYQAENFERASRAGTLVEDFRIEIAEARQLFVERIDERVRSERDYLIEELMRVAEDRRAG